MYTLECQVGRLIEIRVQPPLTLDELRNFLPQAARILARVRGLVVACTELRHARVFSPDVTEKLMTILRTEGPRVERSAFLVGEGAVFSMQIARMLREAGGPSRRAFAEPEDAIHWLSELLTPVESRRLREFVAGG